MDRSGRTDFLLTAICFLAALTIRMAFFVGGVRGSDAFAYALYAHQMATGTYDPVYIFNFYGFRYAVLLPIALSYKVFGVGDVPSVIFPYLFSSLQAALTFLLAHELIGRRGAIIAAILIIFYPLDVCMANILGPDAFIPFFATGALFCYTMGEKKGLTILILISGTLVGLAYLSRVTSIFLLFAFAFYLLTQRQKIRNLGWMLAGFFVPLVGEALYYYYQTGDPFLHFHRLSVHDDLVRGANPDAIVSLSFYPRVMGGFDLTGLALYGLIWWIVMAGLIVAWRKKASHLSLMAVSIIIPWLGFELGWQNLKEMTPIMKNYNYLSLFTGPAIIIAAYALSSLYTWEVGQRDITKKLVVGIIWAIVMMNLYGAYRVTENVRDDAAPYEKVAAFLSRSERRPVFIHHERWGLFLRYFLKYDPSWDLRLVEDLPEKHPPAYLILHLRYLNADTAGRPMKPLPLQRFWSNPPPSWKRELAYTGQPLYNSVIVYALPPGSL